jgi:hypothetical protein
MLLRKPHVFTANELELAAERAWRISFADGKSSKHFVVKSGKSTFIKAGPHIISFFYYPGPYIDNPKTNIEWLPQASQQRAWSEHLFCIGVDYLSRDVDVELGYCALSKLVAEILDGNCTGVYIPRESALIPNDETAYLELQKIASSRESGVIVDVTPD